MLASSLYQTACFGNLKKAGSLGVKIKHNSIDGSKYVLLESVEIVDQHKLLEVPKVPRDLGPFNRALPSAVLEAAKGYIPRPVIEMMISHSMRSVNELRKVTVIFINLISVRSKPNGEPDPDRNGEEEGSNGETQDEDQFLHEAQLNVLNVQSAAYSYYGTLRQVIVDDKGFVAIVVFGLPPFFLEDNAARAIKVANQAFLTQKM